MKAPTLFALFGFLIAGSGPASAQSTFQERQRAYSDQYVQNGIREVSARLARENLRILKKFSAFIQQNGGTSSPVPCNAIRISFHTGMGVQAMLGASAKLSYSELVARHRDHVTNYCEVNLNNGSACRLRANTDWTSFIAGYDNRQHLGEPDVVCFDAKGKRSERKLVR